MNKIIQNNVELSVNINGRPVRVYSFENKLFFESRVGTEYTLTIKNNNYQRVEVVAAVDGLSVLTGKTASIEDSGYIVNAHDEVTIKGFRKDLTEVGAFKFTEKSNSYAAEQGQGSNVGVIAFAVYKEKYVAPTYIFNSILRGNIGEYTSPSVDYVCADLSYKSTSGISTYIADLNASVNYSAQSKGESASYDHGTTWGSKIQDKVTTVTFERESTPLLVQEIFYNSREKLQEMGVKLVHEAVINTPVGFPASFATPPKNWR